MKIVLTGGGSGGHFYPLIAVAQEINAYVQQHALVQPELYYLSNAPYDEAALFENNITFKHVDAGKMRTYASASNVTDAFKTLTGLPTALKLLYKIWPDVVFSKGGYGSVPVVLAARILRIPVCIHDSDSIPGRANLWAGKFATRVAISYPEAESYFPHKERVALTGNPVRKELLLPVLHDEHAHFNLAPDVPTLLILGGSQGAEAINTTLLKGIKEVLDVFQVIHQTGTNNFDACVNIAEMELARHDHKDRYHAVPMLPAAELRKAASVADLIISRAGSGAIYEIAAWEKPAILVPIPESVSRDQRTNAYAYARAGGAEVIEQENFTPHVLLSEAQRILSDVTIMEHMRDGARAFKKPDAARTIAQELLKIALKHEA